MLNEELSNVWKQKMVRRNREVEVEKDTVYVEAKKKTMSWERHASSAWVQYQLETLSETQLGISCWNKGWTKFQNGYAFLVNPFYISTNL